VRQWVTIVTKRRHRKQRKRALRERKFKRYQYKSDFEKRIASQLKKAKVTFGYETVRLDYVTTKKYVPDFVVGNVIIETKGYFDAQARSKMRAVKESNPSLDIRLLFMQDNKINKNSEFRYSDWCIRHGFKFAFKSVPKEWLSSES
jgi:Phage endonuclease I